jgi:hypothetical protein
MGWVRHYKKNQCVAHSLVKRIKRRDEMAKKKNKSAGKGIAADSIPANPGEASVPPEKHFILASGGRIGSLEELAHMMDSISEDDFSHHVNDTKNDFSNWIRDVFSKPELADAIYPIKDRKESQLVLLKHLVREKR